MWVWMPVLLNDSVENSLRQVYNSVPQNLMYLSLIYSCIITLMFLAVNDLQIIKLMSFWSVNKQHLSMETTPKSLAEQMRTVGCISAVRREMTAEVWGGSSSSYIYRNHWEHFSKPAANKIQLKKSGLGSIKVESRKFCFLDGRPLGLLSEDLSTLCGKMCRNHIPKCRS